MLVLTQACDLDMLAYHVLQATIEKVVWLQSLPQGNELLLQMRRRAA